MRQVFFLLMIIMCICESRAQNFYFGVDLSYVNEMEDCGVNYKEGGLNKDPFQIFADHQFNLVRLRLWHSPSWYETLNLGNTYSDLQDVILSSFSARSRGMQTLLDFHLSDRWADPTHQVVPAAWANVVDDLEVLKDSLHQYIYHTLTVLSETGLLPEIVQIGNETNKGILLSQAVNDQGWSVNWPRNAALFNEAIAAVREVETASGQPIKIAIHIADPSMVDWYIDQFLANGVQDFDVIGISYYHAWHQDLIPTVGNIIGGLKNSNPGKEVMILETAYPWTTGFEDNANNVLSGTYPGYPVSPEKQRDWMITLTQEVINRGGSGVVYWEPAWQSSDCETLFGTGSNWENATFFDFDDNLIDSGGIAWASHQFDFPSAIEEFSSSEFNIQIAQHDGELWMINSVKEGTAQPYHIMLSGIDGKLAGKERVTFEPGEAKRVFEKLNLVNGTYVLLLNNENGFWGKLLIKHGGN